MRSRWTVLFRYEHPSDYLPGIQTKSEQEILGQMKNKFPDFDANKLTATAVAKRDATPNLFARNKVTLHSWSQQVQMLIYQQ